MKMDSMRKFAFIASLAAGAGALAAFAQGEDPRWLVAPNVNTLDTSHVTPSSPALAKALSESAELVLRWQLPKDGDAWTVRRREVDSQVRRALGLVRNVEQSPLHARTLRTHDFGDYFIENVVFDSRPGFPVTANVYRAKTPEAGRRPAVLVPIGHYLVAGKTASENQILCTKLARLGFVVMTYDAIGHGERMLPGNTHHEAGYALLPLGQTIAGWMIQESMRALDYLASREDVDANRIGMTGNSGGGLNTLYTAALDPRVHAAAVAGYTFQFNDWIKHAGPHCTCNYLPGLYQSMEWFEIAGLIAPRPLLMMQGERDSAFPATGARRAGRDVESLYSILGSRAAARLDIIPGQPHAYSRPFRERMYGWMLHHLAGQGDGSPVEEGDIQALPQSDRRLICDQDGSMLSAAPTVTGIARQQARDLVLAMPPAGSHSLRSRLRRDVAALVKPPRGEPDYLMSSTRATVKLEDGSLEKIFYLSEIGQHIPGLLWKPGSSAGKPRTVILADDAGKAAVARSGLAEALTKAGFTVLALDLRGRGETLGVINESRDNNYHFVGHSVMSGLPLAGRRAYDLVRAIDYLARRNDLSTDGLTVIGLGDDALPALLAAASDDRIKAIACARYSTSFASQIVAAHAPSRDHLARIWNGSAMNRGRIDNGSYQVDLGSVIPSMLRTGDVPDLASLIAPRRLLFSQARDNQNEDAAIYNARFQRVAAAADPENGGWFRFEPDRQFDSETLLLWLEQHNPKELEIPK